jgi:hypothetical protein
LDVDGVSNRDTIRAHARTESQCEENVAKLPIVSAVGRRIEAEQLCVSLFIDVEKRDEMVTLQRGRSRKRRKEELRRSWRIILTGSAACAWSASAAGAGADA